MVILFVSLSPVIIIAGYIYYRDKYEREPFGMLLRALIAGFVITPFAVVVENLISETSGITTPFFEAFVVAATVEEVLKYLAFMIVIWGNRNFNEKFDGIIYASFISLGFAAIENILYVFSSGIEVGILRAFTAVPAHALFGIVMGFYLGIAKFYPEQKTTCLLRALFYPLLLHGLYDFILMAGNGLLLLGFIPFVVILWYNGFKLMAHHSSKSPFRL